MPNRPAVIVIDDEIAVVNSVLYQLKSTFGQTYVYESAQSIKEATELVRELEAKGNKVKLIICDWLLPPDNSSDFLTHIAQNYPHIHTIMLSGYVHDSAVERAFTESNLQKYLRKPWDEDQLLEVVGEILNR